MTLIIAEAGVNHNGNIDQALKLVDAAKEAGADIVKFQTFRTEKVLRRSDKDFDLIKNLELSDSDFLSIASHCRKAGIEFVSTPGDLDSLRFLVEECGVRRIKIGSDDLNNKPLVDSAYATGLPVYLSTGMATMADVVAALPRTRIDNLTLMHCVSLYPCPPEEANLRAIQTLADVTKYPVGYSDHTIGISACVAAVTLGATIVEKHFTLNTHDKGPDHAISADPNGLSAMIIAIRRLEAMLGHGRKEPNPGEMKIRDSLRKGADGLRGVIKDPLRGYAWA